jgi:hypothetical protein
MRLDSPFIVRKACGKILCGDGEALGYKVVIEMRKKVANWKNQKLYKTVTNNKGEFCFKGVKDGEHKGDVPWQIDIFGIELKP